jgi:hypothetical protein
MVTVVPIVTVLPHSHKSRYKIPEIQPISYVGSGVTVVNRKLEQSNCREVTSGILPVRVPVTARAQLFALQPSRWKTDARVTAAATSRFKAINIIFNLALKFVNAKIA